eukprot:935220-Pyramimonas_sp.AAC.1
MALGISLTHPNTPSAGRFPRSAQPNPMSSKILNCICSTSGLQDRVYPKLQLQSPEHSQIATNRSSCLPRA